MTSEHGFAFVKCCERNDKRIYIVFEDNLFYLEGEGYDTRIEYCPWCGILLDTNLLEE